MNNGPLDTLVFVFQENKLRECYAANLARRAKEPGMAVNLLGHIVEFLRSPEAEKLRLHPPVRESVEEMPAPEAAAIDDCGSLI